MSDVVTYELEHVGLEAAAAAGELAPLRPGLAALRATQDRLAERRFIRDIGEWTAPWREVRGVAEAEAAAEALGYPVRLKLPARRLRRPHRRSGSRPGARSRPRWRPSAVRTAGRCCWSGRSTSRRSCRSCARATATGRTLAYPVSRNVHDAGILAESVAPAPIHPLIANDAREVADSIARGLDLVGRADRGAVPAPRAAG